jgi:hypothetical protein
MKNGFGVPSRRSRRRMSPRQLGDLGAQIAEVDPDALRELVEEAEGIVADASARNCQLAEHRATVDC